MSAGLLQEPGHAKAGLPEAQSSHLAGTRCWVAVPGSACPGSQNLSWNPSIGAGSPGEIGGASRFYLG